jgi:hypothetical protein
MNAYYEVLRVLKTSLQDNKDVNTVTQGDISEIDINKQNIYPLAHVELSNGSFNENTIQFNCTLHALDQKDINKAINTDKFTGNDNEIDVMNTMLFVLRRTYLELAKDMRTEDITILGEPNITQVTNTANNIIGWQMEFQIEVPDKIISVCD